jgi:hypothetical protein
MKELYIIDSFKRFVNLKTFLEKAITPGRYASGLLLCQRVKRLWGKQKNQGWRIQLDARSGQLQNSSL